MHSSPFDWNTVWRFDLPFLQMDGGAGLVWSWSGPLSQTSPIFPWATADARVSSGEMVSTPGGVDDTSLAAYDPPMAPLEAPVLSSLDGMAASGVDAAAGEDMSVYLSEPTMVRHGASGVLWFDRLAEQGPVWPEPAEPAPFGLQAGELTPGERAGLPGLQDLVGLYGFSGALGALFSEPLSAQLSQHLTQSGEPALEVELARALAAARAAEGGGQAGVGAVTASSGELGVGLETADMPTAGVRVS